MAPRSERTARDNARARSLGYRDYYDYRIHNYGRVPASAPAPTGEARTRLRGHRSAADLERLISSGRAELLLLNVSRRDPQGKIREVEVMVTTSDGEQRIYRLRGRAVTPDALRGLQAAVDDGPDTMLVVGSPGARKLVDDEEPDELEAQLEADIEDDEEGSSMFSDEDIPF